MISGYEPVHVDAESKALHWNQSTSAGAPLASYSYNRRIVGTRLGMAVRGRARVGSAIYEAGPRPAVAV